MQAQLRYQHAIVICAILLLASGCNGKATNAPAAPAASAPTVAPAATAEPAATTAPTASAPAAPAASAPTVAPAATAEPAATTAPAASAPTVCTDPALDFTSISVNTYTSAGNDPNFPAIANSFAQGLNASGAITGAVGSDLSNLDQSMLVFYTGHGKADGPTDDAGNTVFTPANLKLGQCAAGQDGKLRYLIVDSCNVFAHGPKCDNPFYPLVGGVLLQDYICPGDWNWDFDGNGQADKDTDTMRNIFDRWGPTLGNNLRMVCGASTLVDPWNATGVASAYGRGTPTPEPVADLIMSSVAQDAVALCLALGGKNFTDSPLATDVEFTPTANAEDEDYYHLQYSKPFTDYMAIKLTLPVAIFYSSAQPAPPPCMPSLSITGAVEPAMPSEGQSLDFDSAGSEKEYLQNLERSKSSESDYMGRAWEILTDWNNRRGQDLILSNFRDSTERYFAYGQRLMLSKIPVEPASWSKQEVTQKSVIIQFPRRIDLFEETAGIFETDPPLREKLGQELGAFYAAIGMDKNVVTGKALVKVLDSSVKIRLNTDKSLIQLTSRWPKVEGRAFLETVPTSTAYEYALKQLGGDGKYLLASWDWGYGQFSPTEMRLYHRFYFVPNEDKGYTGEKYPPRTIRIEGQTENKCMQ